MPSAQRLLAEREAGYADEVRRLLDASLAAHAAMGELSDLLWQTRPPARSDVEGMTRFCVAAVTSA